MSSSNLKSKALYFLARREYAYQELFTKLKKYSDDDEAITSALNEMIKLGYLCEQRYIETYLSSKSTKYGLLNIKHNLNQKTANPQLVAEIINAAAIDEYNTARELWRKKFGTPATDKTQLAKQIRFLLSRGFSYSLIKKVINSASLNDEEDI